MANHNKAMDDWNAYNQLSRPDIDFIETIITFTSAARHLQNKLVGCFLIKGLRKHQK